MKTSRNLGTYIVTGYTQGGLLVQYSVWKNGHGWSVEKITPNGINFHMLYSTKREAVAAIESQP